MGIRDWFRAPVPLTPLVAAAASVNEPGALERVYTTSSRATVEAWKIWRGVGEIHYATTQQARLVSRCGWDVSIDGEQLEPEDAEELLLATFGPNLSNLAKTGALHLQVAGGYLLARFPDQGWQIFGVNPDYRAKAILKKADITISVTTPDPEDPTRLDSPVIAVIDVATELLLARAQSRASARNRTAQQGLVLFPLEGAGPDPEKFKRDLVTVITAPLADERSTASVVPNLIGFPSDLIEKWSHLNFADDYDGKLHIRIEALVRQIATILDIPPQLLLGMGDINHWTAWAVQEDNWFGHTEPLAAEVGQGFAEAMAVAASMDPNQIEVTPDPANLVKRRPTIAEAIQAFSVNLVSGEWTRAQLGADDDDAPDALVLEEPEPEEEVVDAEIVEEPQTPVAAAAGPPFDTRRLMQIDRQALDSTIDLCEAALVRVAERVGAQMRARVQGDQALRDSIVDIPNEELPRKMGEQLASLPGLSQTITDTLVKVLPRSWSTLVKRAFSATRSAGIDVTLDPADLDESLAALTDSLSGVAVSFMMGEAVDAQVWKAAQRALALAGGGADPSPPVTAAFGLPSPLGLGIALGSKAILWVAREVGLLAREFRWVYGSDPRSTPHPVHEALDGRTFNGEALFEDGVMWYPGDHAGCLCGVEPIWEAA